MNIVLYEPEMPANTGNIGRTCVATNTRLHLIEPLGFKLSEKHLVRAGLDYWDKLDVTVYSDFADFLKRNPGAKLYMATTKAPAVYTDVKYEPDCYLMFGPESRGIPGGDPGGVSGNVRPDPHVGGHPVPEPVQFRGCPPLRGAAAERV